MAEPLVPAPSTPTVGRGLNGLTAEDVPAEVSAEASRPLCCPGARFAVGFGYAGGGFGPYRRCYGCGEIYGKTSARDGNELPLR